MSIESTDDEFATNVSQAANGKDDDDDEAFQRLSLSVDNMTIKPQCESEEDADDEDYSRIESQSRSGSVGLSSNSSFHDDGFQKVFVPGSYNSMSSSTWGIVNNKDSPESLHGQATAAKKSEEFENVEEKMKRKLIMFLTRKSHLMNGNMSSILVSFLFLFFSFSILIILFIYPSLPVILESFFFYCCCCCLVYFYHCLCIIHSFYLSCPILYI